MANLGAKIHYHLENLIRILMIVFAVRAVLLLLNLPFRPIPYIDDTLYLFWDLIIAIIRLVSGSSLLPRFM